MQKKLSQKTKLDIYADYLNGELTTMDIAIKYDVSISTVNKYIAYFKSLEKYQSKINKVI